MPDAVAEVSQSHHGPAGDGPAEDRPAGDGLVGAIVKARKARGGFKSIDQLVEVKGIGQVLLEDLKAHVTLSGKTTARRE